MAEEKSNALSSHIEMKKVWELLAIFVVTTIVWNLPTSAFGIDGLTVVQQRIIAIFVFATLAWLTECIPACNLAEYHGHHVCHCVQKCFWGL